MRRQAAGCGRKERGVELNRHSNTSGPPQLIPIDELAQDELEAWQALRASNPSLDSPYFHPGFAAAIHESGQPVVVAVLRDAVGRVRALLPGHHLGGRLLPVGWPGADFQAPIAGPGAPIEPLDLIPAGIREIYFDHLLSPGPHFDPWVIASEASPFIDTSGGLEGYLGRASKAGKENMGQARRRAAKAEREIGPVRFAADVVDEAALSQVIAMKRAQYAATGSADYFDDPRRVALMSLLLHARGSEFAGLLSTVHIGEQLIAAHFGIRSGGVLHWWFPVYEPEMAHLSPGWILLRELVAAAPQLGVTRIDLGRGDDEYKRRAKTGEVLVCRAALTRSATRRMAHRAHHSLVQLAKGSTMAPTLRPLVRTLRTIRGGRARTG